MKSELNNNPVMPSHCDMSVRFITGVSTDGLSGCASHCLRHFVPFDH
jgi:hypothetical protein